MKNKQKIGWYKKVKNNNPCQKFLIKRNTPKKLQNWELMELIKKKFVYGFTKEKKRN